MLRTLLLLHTFRVSYVGTVTTLKFSPMTQQSLVGQSLLTPEAEPSHSDTPHAVGLLWMNDQPVSETSGWQHTTFTTDRHPCPYVVCFLLGNSPASEFFFHLPLKMEQIEGSETSAFRTQTPRNYPKENILYKEDVESLWICPVFYYRLLNVTLSHLYFEIILF